jgi:hypothetical protein
MAQPGRLLPADLAQRPNFDAAEQKTVSATDDDDAQRDVMGTPAERVVRLSRIVLSSTFD